MPNSDGANMQTFLELLKEFRKNDFTLSNTPYDSAWVARLKDVDANMSDMALEWICEHQLSDGSWGASFPFYYHDRVVCTLACMIALTYRGKRQSDKNQISAGLAALDEITSGATGRLQLEPSATVGFEMIVPTLITEAERLGLMPKGKELALSRLAKLRETKMSKLQGIKVSRQYTIAHSAEMVGKDRLEMLDPDNLQESNGSVGNSPAATAHFALYVRAGDEKALNYLRPIVTARKGGAPTLTPLELFELNWVMWNFSLTDLYQKDHEIAKVCNIHLDYLEENWKSGQGLGFSSSYSVVDADDTFVGYEVLSKLGRNPELAAVLQYEEENWFRCFHLEANPSIDVNIHVLGALKQAGYDRTHLSVQKALRFIRTSRMNNSYFFDKWNLSPYYTTAHLIISAKGYDDELCKDSVRWILETQQANGSWRSFSQPTAEETAYCIQALTIWQKHTGISYREQIQKAVLWLQGHSEPPYPPLWIGKSLYAPQNLITSSILSALELAKESL
jgi:halimadienyl-diphosphate synthase